MPQMSGLDFLKKIREKDTDCKIKILLISAFIKSDLNVDGLLNSLKIDKVIEKPIRLENLIAEVNNLLVN
jgi:DNA-binding response OmpR family regulator